MHDVTPVAMVTMVAVLFFLAHSATTSRERAGWVARCVESAGSIEAARKCVEVKP